MGVRGAKQAAAKGRVLVRITAWMAGALALLILGSVAGAASAASAATATTAGEPAGGAADSGGLKDAAKIVDRLAEVIYELADTVQVPGSRIPGDPARAPAAITVLEGADLRSVRGVGIDEALAMVPGVTAFSRSGGTDVRITARGFGARGAGERSNAGTTRGIRILLDGSPLTEPDGRTSLDLADPAALERITVMRSNGSVLFGSASGGVIDLATPSAFRGPFTEIQGGGGSFGLARWGVSQGLVSGTTRVYLGGSGSTFDGWRKHSENDRTVLRGSMFLDPTPHTSVALHATGAHNLSRIPGALTLAEVTDRDSAEAANPAFVTRNERRDNRIVRVSASVQERYAPSRVLQFEGFVEPKTIHRSERNRYRNFQRIHEGGSVLHAWTFAPASDVALRWSAGADLAWQDGSTVFYNLGPGGSRGPETIADKREAIQTFGIFSELEAKFAERWTVTAGLRHDNIRYVYDDYIDASLDARKSLRELTPRGAVAYQLSPRHTAWVAVTSGLEAPAFNEVDPPPEVTTPTGLNPFVKPARSLTFEGGLKGAIVGPRAGSSGDVTGETDDDDAPSGWLQGWSYDLCGYSLEVKNDIIPWDGGAYYFTNGKSRRTGVEIGTGLRAAGGVSLRLAGALSRNKYVTYTNDLGTFDDQWSAGIPGRSVNAVVRWEPRPGFYVEASGRHCGPYYADDKNTARVPAWTAYDGAIGARIHAGGVQADLSLSARNLGDTLYVESVWVNGAGGRFYEPGLPRNFVGAVTLRME